MKVNLLLLTTFSIWTCCFAPPVTKTKENKENEAKEEAPDNLELAMHYHRYLKEVVGTLESDNEFKKKLEAADEADIRSGKIAHELEFVSHQVRTRLDELKRQELDRLKSLKRQLNENEVIEDPNHGHLDHGNPHTFEIEDLKKLIAKTTQDLAEADKKRRDEFKQYEMQKEYEKFEKLNHTNGDDRKKLEKEYEDLESKHKKHQPLHEPGHKAQLEEVWEEQDQMQQEFDPKTFFMMHDLDSNGLWDQNEVKALFVKELDKMYTSGAPEDDLQERLEEMERMREQVFQEVDVNKDNFIDFHEFLAQTKKQDFQQDNGWKGLDEQKPYSDQELEAYIRQHHMQQQGYYQVPPGHYPPPGGSYNPNQVPQYQGYPQHQGQMAPPQHSNQGQQQYQHPQQYQPHPDQQQYQPNLGQQQYQPHPGQQQYQPHPGQQQYQPHPGQQQYQPHSGQQKQQPSQEQIQNLPSQVSNQQQNAQVEPNQGQMKPELPQVHPNQKEQDIEKKVKEPQVNQV